MKRPALERKLHVFADDGARTVTVDRLKLVISPSHSYVPRDPITKEHLDHVAQVLAERFDASPKRGAGRQTFDWREDVPGLHVQQNVGCWQLGRRRLCVSQVVFANPLRALARNYEARGLMSLLVGDPDNVVYPFRVRPEVVSADIFPFIADLARARVDAYCGVYELLVGRSLPPDQVRVSVAEIELTWDRTCEAASYAPIAYWNPWAQRLVDSRLHAKGPFLKAKAANGEQYKLYAKTERVLRYEVALSQDRIRDRLGHSLNPLDPVRFEGDVRALAGPLYRSILDIQTCVVPTAVIDPSPLIEALFGRAADVVRRIFQAFASGGCFENKGKDQRALRSLRRLRAKGYAHLLPDGKGLWGARGPLESLIRQVRYRTLSVGSETISPPTGKRSVEGCDRKVAMAGPREMHIIAAEMTHGSKTIHKRHRALRSERDQSLAPAKRKS